MIPASHLLNNMKLIIKSNILLLKIGEQQKEHWEDVSLLSIRIDEC